MYLVCATISEISLPLSRTSTWPRCSACFSMSWAMRRITLPRAVGVICGHGPLSNAREAASTARSASALSHSGISAQGSPV